jgi:hypothetical protein
MDRLKPCCGFTSRMRIAGRHLLRSILTASGLFVSVLFGAPSLGFGAGVHTVAAESNSEQVAPAGSVFMPDAARITWFASEASVTGSYFNVNADIRWRNPGGDWSDAKGVEQGTEAFATTIVRDTDSVKQVTWNVTALVKAWQAEPTRSTAILLRARKGDAVWFHSNQAPGSEPRLFLTFEDGQVIEHPVPHDTSVGTSTVYAQGSSAKGQISREVSYLLQWERAKLFSEGAFVTSASLRMVSIAQYGTTEIGAYQLSIPVRATRPPIETGLAARYVADSGLSQDPDVVFFEDFRGTLAQVQSRWDGARFTAIDACDLPGVAQCVKATVKGTAEGGNGLTGTGGRKVLPRELDEAYMRYYVKFGSWTALDGGKHPGLANYDSGDGQSYFAGGNGGSRVHGYDGWTLRGSFGRPLGPLEPAPGWIPLGTYAYHGAMTSDYGDGWSWSPMHTDLHLMRPGEWHAVEQHVKVNTPGLSDGMFEVWIDGRKVLSMTDVFLRDDPAKVPRTYPNGRPVPAEQNYWVPGSMGIRKLWADLYHGGTTPSEQTLVVHWANFVVATKYIGPMGRAP